MVHQHCRNACDIGCKMIKTIRTLWFILFMSMIFSAYADDAGFTVKHIQVRGLQRVQMKTAMSYIPVHVGDQVTTKKASDIIHALYDTQFFQYVRLDREGDTLVVTVVERATIGSIHVKGNKEIPKDSMKAFLKNMGLVKGQVFQHASLEHLEKELKKAYNMRGRYNARIDTNVKPLAHNRVDIDVDISEGRVSRIREIQFTGNHHFSSHELISEMSLAPAGLFTYFTKKDQYSKEALASSLESIRNFYLDRGYIQFQVVSSQVLLSPDKKDVFITIHVKEGPLYRFSGFSVVKQKVLPQEKIESLITFKKDDVFSREKVMDSISAITIALGDLGYGFPVINADPQVDERSKTVFIRFVIEPGRHVYVRRIQFHGNTKTADYVLRNVIRQNEGALLTSHGMKESERQLRVLGYLKNVSVKTTPVPNTNNQVDLDVEVEEAPSAEAKASIGYGTNGPQFDASFSQHNFLGTGRSVGLGFNASYWGQDYVFNYYNPFYTDTGIGRGVDIYYQVVSPKKLDIGAYSSDRMGGDVDYHILLTENSKLVMGYGYQNLSNIKSGNIAPYQDYLNSYGMNFNELRLHTDWVRNTYDQMPFPTEGTNQKAVGTAALPVVQGSLSYYKVAYQARLYQPLFAGFIFTAFGNVGYGGSFNKTPFPFFENYYAGGIAQPGQIRGYESYSLGPQDALGNSLGGNFLINGTVAVILPYPLSRDVVRTSLFLDGGNLYARGMLPQYTGTPAGPVRFGSGVSVEWRSPFGPLAFNLAAPLNKQPGDQEQVFQFSVLSSF